MGALPLSHNFAWTLAGNVTYMGCQWGILVLLTKLGTPEMVGQFVLGLAIGGPIMMLANLQLRSVQATDSQDEYRFGEFLALRIFTTALAFVGICLIAWTGGYRWETIQVVILVGVTRAVESLSDVVYGLMQKYERLDRIAVAMMARGIGSVLAVAMALWSTGGVAWAVVGMAASSVLVLVLYEWEAARRLFAGRNEIENALRPLWGVTRLKALGKLSLPLGVTMMLLNLNTNIPRYFVEHHYGEAALGYFAALAYPVVAGSNLMSALGQSASPRLARYYQSDRRAFQRLLAKMLLIAIAVGSTGVLIAVLQGRQILTLLYRPDYAEHAQVFVWLMIAAAISYVLSTFGYVLTSQRNFRPQVGLVGMMVVVSTAACYFAVPAFGIGGAAVALVASNLVGAMIGAGLVIQR